VYREKMWYFKNLELLVEGR